MKLQIFVLPCDQGFSNKSLKTCQQVAIYTRENKDKKK